MKYIDALKIRQQFDENEENDKIEPTYNICSNCNISMFEDDGALI